MIRKIILITIGATLIVGIFAAGFTFMMDDYYTATTLLVMTPVPLNVRDYIPSILDGREDTPYRVSFLTLNDIPTFPMPDYEQIYNSDEIIEQVLLYLLQKEEYKDVKLSRTKLRKSMSIESKIFFQGTNQIQYQRIIQMQFTSKNPELSADVCNYWADLGMSKIESLRQEPLKDGIAYLEKTLNEKKSELANCRKALEQLEAGYYLPGMEMRIQELENQITSFKIQQTNLNLEIEQLAKEIELNVKGNTDRTPIPGTENTPTTDIEQYKKEQILKTSQKEALQKQIADLEQDITHLRQVYAEKKREKQTLEDEQIQLRQIVENLKITYQNSLANLEKSQSELRIASKALPPRQKAGPPRTLYILSVMVLTFVAVPTIYIGLLVANYYLNKFERELTLPF
ncbi:MAG: hypothetical protein ACP5KS_00135 [Candidatus Hydrogenedens sp.]